MPKLKSKLTISLDTETTGIDFHHGARPFFVTIGHPTHGSYYWEWDVGPKTRMPKVPIDDLWEVLDWIKRADRIVLQNSKFDVKALKTLIPDLDWPWHKTEDTLIAGHLLASDQPHDLTTMALTYLGVDIQPYEEKLKEVCDFCRRYVRTHHKDWRIAKAGDPMMPSAGDQTWKFDTWLPRALHLTGFNPVEMQLENTLSDYANTDSLITLKLFEVMEKLLKEQGLWNIYKFRMEVLPVAHRMEIEGLSLSQTRLQELTVQYAEESEKAARVCMNIAANHNYELTLPKSGRNGSLNTFIFDVLKLPTVSVTKKSGNASLDKRAMEKYLEILPPRSQAYTFLKNLQNKRKRDTAATYMEGYKRHWQPCEQRGWFRLYPSLNPTGTRLLRWSSNNPNEQNISKQEGFNLRYCFGPLPDEEWWSLDYENIELRIPAYESGEQVMIEIFEKPNDPPYFGSYHLLNASIVYPELFWPLAEQKGAFKKKYASSYYQWIKNFGFAVSYGAVPESGTADAAAHKPGAQLMVMDKLREHTKLNQRMIDHANRYGYVETIPDKEVDPERGYPLWCERSAWGRVKPTLPLNAHVQGSACWVMLKAMVLVDKYLQTIPGAGIVMQIHDELVIKLKKGPNNVKIVEKVRSLMQSVGEHIGVPLTCGMEYHPNNWSESEKW